MNRGYARGAIYRREKANWRMLSIHRDLIERGGTSELGLVV